MPFHHDMGALVHRGSEGVKKLAGQCFRLKPVVYVLIAFFSPFILLLIAAGISYVAEPKLINFQAVSCSPAYKTL